MPYVDGFVIPVPKSNIETYKKIATECGEIWRRYGALEYRECIAEDVKPGKLTSFPQSVNLKDDEVVIFSWIVFESRAHRDEVNANVMKDPYFANHGGPEDAPFDATRLIYGGFETIVDL